MKKIRPFYAVSRGLDFILYLILGISGLNRRLLIGLSVILLGAVSTLLISILFL